MTTVLDGGLSTLPALDTYMAGTEGAGTSNILGGDGTNLSRRVRRQESREYRQRLLGLSRIYRGMLEGSDRAALAFKEAMSRSDFTYLFGDVIDRQLLASYATREPQ